MLLLPGGTLLIGGIALALPGAALVAVALRRLMVAYPDVIPALERGQGQGDSWSRVSNREAN